MTWNPVIGCKNNCNYCYARTMNKRFKFIKNWNSPEWKEKSFKKKFPKKPQRIFVGSMSEIAHWEREWMEKVLDKIKLYPQHIFQFLTRESKVYRKYIFPNNCWLGITVTGNKEACYFDFGVAPENANLIKFVSIEPILGRIKPESLYHLKANWVIIGTETGNRKNKVNQEKWIFDWVYDIVTSCKKSGIPLYIKDSIGKLYPGFPDTGEVKEFPKRR